MKSYLKTQEEIIGGSAVLKNGDLATYLVKDLIFCTPKDEKAEKNFGKPNNQEYKRLHSMLALYSADKAGLVALMAQTMSSNSTPNASLTFPLTLTMPAPLLPPKA